MMRGSSGGRGGGRAGLRLPPGLGICGVENNRSTCEYDELINSANHSRC
jgi:hypothetical protein